MDLSTIDRLLDIPAKYSFFGIPGDTLAHVIVGFGLYYLVATLTRSPLAAFLVVAIAEFFKALVVSLSATMHSKQYFHALLEVFATFVGAGLAGILWKKRSRRLHQRR